jgi:hypothetical protein
MQQPECPGCRGRDARIAALEAKVADLKSRVNDLTERLVSLAKRNWEKMLSRGGKAKMIGECCLSVHKRVFDLRHLFRGDCSRSQLDDGMTLMLELLEVLHAGRRCRDAKTKRFCNRLLGCTPRCGRLWWWKVSNRPTTTSSAPQRRAVQLFRTLSPACPLQSPPQAIRRPRLNTSILMIGCEIRPCLNLPQHSELSGC